MARMSVLVAAAMALGVTAFAHAATAPAATPLLPKDIQAKFGTGKPFHGVAASGGASFTMVFKADGTAEMDAVKGKKTTTGTWRLSDKGYCSKWGKTGTEHCYTVEQNGKAFDVMDGDHKVIAHWTI